MENLDTRMQGLSWLQPQGTPGEAWTRGLNAGANVGQNFLQSQRQAEDRRQFDALAPLREAEREYTLQKTALALKDQTIQAENDLEQRRGISELGDVVSSVGERPERWMDPNLERDVWKVASKHPGVMKHPAFNNIIENFTLAKQADERRRSAEAELAFRETTLAEKVLADEAKLDIDALKVGAGLEKAALTTANKQQGVVDTVTERQRETWIANRAAKLLKDNDKMTQEEAFRQARGERAIAGGRQYTSSAERRAAEAVAAPAPATSGPARPVTMDDYKALPSGAFYIHPTTGGLKQKP